MKAATLLLPLLLLCSSASAAPLVITAADWAKPRTGQAMIAHPALVEAVQPLLAGDAKGVQIRYPGGDEGTVWALEIRAWLVALGFDSDQIALAPGSPSRDAVELRAVP